MIRKILKYLEKFCNIQKNSEIFRKIVKYSEKFRIIQKNSEKFRQIQTQKF